MNIYLYIPRNFLSLGENNFLLDTTIYFNTLKFNAFKKSHHLIQSVIKNFQFKNFKNKFHRKDILNSLLDYKPYNFL